MSDQVWDYEEDDDEEEYEEEYDGHPKWLQPESCSECPETYMGSDPDSENGLCYRCNNKLGNFRDCRDCGGRYIVGNRSSTGENGLCANCQRKFRAQNGTDES